MKTIILLVVLAVATSATILGQENKNTFIVKGMSEKQDCWITFPDGSYAMLFEDISEDLSDTSYYRIVEWINVDENIVLVDTSYFDFKKMEELKKYNAIANRSLFNR